MIPNANNINNYNNQIKIQLTNDNKCIIQTLSESQIKSQNTNLKEEFQKLSDFTQLPKQLIKTLVYAEDVRYELSSDFYSALLKYYLNQTFLCRV